MTSPICDSHLRLPIGAPTDGRTDGRTYEESFSPTRDNPSSSVTRTRTYGFSPLADSELEPDCDHRHQTDTAPFDEPYPVWICFDRESRCES